MSEPEKLFFENQQAFRKWLESHHHQNQGIWMVFYKRHTGMEGISYQEALEEALCFGWIDSLIKKIDDNRYVRKFTPRTNTAKWSEINKKMVDKMIKEGRMTEAGLSKIESYLKNGRVDWTHELARKPVIRELSAPDFMLDELALNEPALSNFNKLPASCQKEYVLWITMAKREETIRKRLKESVVMLKENKKLGLK